MISPFMNEYSFILHSTPSLVKTKGATDVDNFFHINSDYFTLFHLKSAAYGEISFLPKLASFLNSHSFWGIE